MLWVAYLTLSKEGWINFVWVRKTFMLWVAYLTLSKEGWIDFVWVRKTFMLWVAYLTVSKDLVSYGYENLKNLCATGSILDPFEKGLF